MTNEEALAHFKNHEYMTDFSWQDEMSEVAISAIEKQMPKKPLKVEKKFDDAWNHVIDGMRVAKCYYHACPECHKELQKPYSCRCGQRIDWEEGEEA